MDRTKDVGDKLTKALIRMGVLTFMPLSNILPMQQQLAHQDELIKNKHLLGKIFSLRLVILVYNFLTDSIQLFNSP